MGFLGEKIREPMGTKGFPGAYQKGNTKVFRKDIKKR